MPRLRFRAKRSPSHLEARFALLWHAANGPALEKELVYHPGRRWRADFAHLQSRTLIEIEGGIWIQGRHNRAEGFLADIEKYFEAALAGWTVFRLSERQLTLESVERIVQSIQTIQTSEAQEACQS
jgi:very-short-patch-repair endonuclease